VSTKTPTPAATSPNSRKDVRNAITATAKAFAGLREQWIVRTDLTDLVERTQAALTAATASLSGTKPTEVIREAQATAGTLLQELMEALSKPAVEKTKTKATRAPRGDAKAPEIRELFRDDKAKLIVNWVMDSSNPRFVVLELTPAGQEDIEHLVVKASRQWATEKKAALDFAGRKAAELKGEEYVEPVVEEIAKRVAKETREVVYGDEKTIAVVMVTGASNSYDVVVKGEVVHSIKATRAYRLQRQEAIGEAEQLAKAA
jgi:hypothetical protein